MSAQKICVTFLLITLSSLTAQAAPTFSQSLDVCGLNGGQVKTITQTVTITAASSAQTSSDVVGHKIVGGSSGINNNSNDNNAGTGNSSNGGNGSNSNEGINGGDDGSNRNEGSVNNDNGGIGSNGNGGSSSNSGGNTDIQSSLTLDPRAIATGFEKDGQDVPTDGQVASLTSSNNFINFCLTVPQLPITNGKQITNGSCNPAPIGLIPTVDNMPSSKFSFPLNFGAVKTNTAFTIKMQIQNMQTGFFVNAQENYFAAPQQLNNKGQIQGHSHVVIEQLNSIEQTVTTNPQKFAFFKGLNDAAVNELLTAEVTNGLPAGAYKLSSINSAANHQPVIVPIAQHGSLDDAIYFFVTDDGKPPTDAPFNGSGGAASSVTTSASSVTSPASSVTGSSIAIPSVSTTGKGNAKSTTAAGNGNEQPTATVVASHKAGASAVSATAIATGKVTGASTASASASASTSAIPSPQGNNTVDSGNDPKDGSQDNSKDKTSAGKGDNTNGKN